MAVLTSFKVAGEISEKEAYRWFQDRQFFNIPPYFLTHWKTGKRFFQAHETLIPFTSSGHQLVVAGEPLVEPNHGDSSRAFALFSDFATRSGRGVCGYYVGRGWQIPSFEKVPVGVSQIIDLVHYQRDRPQFKEIRRSLRMGRRLGYNVIPINSGVMAHSRQLGELMNHWRSQKHSIDVGFFLSDPRVPNRAGSYEEGFAIEYKGEFLAFCSLLPYIQKGELCFYMDHLVHDPRKGSHALGYLISVIVEILADEGAHHLNLGLCPFAKTSFHRGSWSEKIFSFLYRFPLFYKAKGLHHFKKKFGGFEEPEFCFFNEHRSQLAQLTQMFSATIHRYKGDKAGATPATSPDRLVADGLASDEQTSDGLASDGQTSDKLATVSAIPPHRMQ